MNSPRAHKLRPAVAHEAQTLAEMSRDLIEAGLGWRYTPQRLRMLIRDPETITVVACDGPRVQGFAVMQFGDERAHLMLLCVRPSRQRCGIGRQLVEWLLASARVAGIASVRVELRADNDAAWAFYRQLGFAQTHLLPAYYDRRLAARRMRLVLRQNAPAA